MSQLPDHLIASACIARPGLRYPGPLIVPFTRKQLQPASYDVRLNSIIRVPHFRDTRAIDLGDSSTVIDRTDEYDLIEHHGYMLQQGRFVLGSTVEVVNIPDYLVGRIEGKSSLARSGIQVHCAGFIDPGFRGNITVELVNFHDMPVILRPNILIAQFSFERLSSPCSDPYAGRYQDSEGVVGSRYHKDGEME